MRKNYKSKRCCCAMCKSHKRHWSSRWKHKDEVFLREFEREALDLRKVG